MSEEGFISYKEKTQTKCRNISHAFSSTLKKKASEYYKCLSFNTNATQQIASSRLSPHMFGKYLIVMVATSKLFTLQSRALMIGC